jgi:hypothetical protein
MRQNKMMVVEIDLKPEVAAKIKALAHRNELI